MENRINKNRLLRRFSDYVAIDSETYSERELGDQVVRDLQRLGVSVRTDTTDEAFLAAHPGSFPNIHGFLRGTAEGETVLLSAHLDTVRPGKGKQAVVREDGTITSDGSTVLGADDVSGLTVILEAIQIVEESGLPHPDIEILITSAEESFCEGSEAFDFRLVHAKKAYVFDLNGAVGTAAVAAPSIVSFSVEIVGRAAHAGFAPELGINAVSIAADALAGLSAGRVNGRSSVNFGTIKGGTADNIVPDRVVITGEVRSFSHEEALRLVNEVFTRFEQTANTSGGTVQCRSREHIRAYHLDSSEAVVRHFTKAAEAAGLGANLITTYGGSDANRLNEHGIPAIVVACAMENSHTTEEYTELSELAKAAELAVALITA
ncbi:MAG: M20/M25/M40 family metallo-hydrolase [Lachnospiraceae bacterium]|nr:M20/M25/M40 family metallo-hydrolase [Lachnospiraceae bacterium]